MTASLLVVDDLHVAVRGCPILHGVSFHIQPREIVGLVGESGSGKSLTACAIMGLLSSSFQSKGNIYFQGTRLVEGSPSFAALRGTFLGLILQDPALALNPLVTIGTQLIEGLCYHKRMGKQEAWEKGMQWLSRVGIGDPQLRMKQYPHEMSGGMKQRVMIAMALLCDPLLLIADEPTTALDVTMQAQILEILLLLQKEMGMSMLLITHDLGVVARCCERVIVMHKGRVVESGMVDDVFYRPQHSYTQDLFLARNFVSR